MTDYNELILVELRSIKDEFTHMRDDIGGIKKDMLNNANNCGLKHAKLGDTFVHSVTFWKITGIILFLLSGSYAYSSIIYKLIVP